MLQYVVLCAHIHSNKTMPCLKNVNSRSHLLKIPAIEINGSPEENSAQLWFRLATVSKMLLIRHIIKSRLAHEIPLCRIKVGVQHKRKEDNESCVLCSYN